MGIEIVISLSLHQSYQNLYNSDRVDVHHLDFKYKPHRNNNFQVVDIGEYYILLSMNRYHHHNNNHIL